MNNTPLEWSDNFSTDIVSIDKQHQELLYLTQQLLNVLSDENASLKEKQAVYQSLLDHAVEHFEYEERVMQNIGYPDYERHLAEHDELRAEIGKITDEVMSGRGIEDWKGLISMVQVWLLRHIVSSDTKFRDFIQHDTGE